MLPACKLTWQDHCHCGDREPLTLGNAWDGERNDYGDWKGPTCVFIVLELNMEWGAGAQAAPDLVAGTDIFYVSFGRSRRALIV